MSSPNSEAITIARQHAKTSLWLGVDFLPQRPGVAPPESASPIESPSSSSTAQSATRPAIASIEPKPIAAPARTTPSNADKAERTAALQALRQRHDTTCPHCTVVTGHTQTVFGEGDPAATLMFIGEAPGEEEDRTGRPFVGRAGQKLDEIIKAMGLTREQVYIANILKSRPPDNRTPLPNEVAGCAPFLAEQVRIIHPRVIVALGGPASKWLLQTDTGITRIRGQWGWYEDLPLRIPVMPTFHPAYLLRNYTMETRKQVWSDMQKAMNPPE